MPKLMRDGVALSYEEAGKGAPPLVFVHGWSGDHSHFAPQMDHFQRSHRVIAVDRRGHGDSDRPTGKPSIVGYADDLAWLIRELGLHRPVVVVHSQGGIGLELAARQPDLVSALVLLDTPLFAPPPVVAGFRDALAGLRSPAYRQVIAAMADQVVFRPGEDAARKQYALQAIYALPQSLLADTWEAFLEHDPTRAAAQCKLPLLFIGATMPVDLARLREACPQLTVGQTVGTGHFHQLEAPEQVNSMIERFVAQNVAHG